MRLHSAQRQPLQLGTYTTALCFGIAYIMLFCLVVTFASKAHAEENTLQIELAQKLDQRIHTEVQEKFTKIQERLDATAPDLQINRPVTISLPEVISAQQQLASVKPNSVETK